MQEDGGGRGGEVKMNNEQTVRSFQVSFHIVFLLPEGRRIFYEINERIVGLSSGEVLLVSICDTVPCEQYLKTGGLQNLEFD